MKVNLRLVITVVVGGLLSMIAVTWVGQHRLCAERVEARDDGRAVWLYLVARAPDRRDDPDVVEFVKFLDSRLPVLSCDWLGRPNNN